MLQSAKAHNLACLVLKSCYEGPFLTQTVLIKLIKGIDFKGILVMKHLLERPFKGQIIERKEIKKARCLTQYDRQVIRLVGWDPKRCATTAA